MIRRSIVLGLAVLAQPAHPQQADLRISEAELPRLEQTARRALRIIQAKSIRENVEYCGYILRRGENRFHIEKPTKGDENGCALAYVPDDGPHVASYHTHSGYAADADSEVPSVIDIEGDMADRLVGYISTPGGRFWRSNSAVGTATMICGLGCMPSDPKFRKDRDDPIPKLLTLDALKRRHGE